MPLIWSMILYTATHWHAGYVIRYISPRMAAVEVLTDDRIYRQVWKHISGLLADFFQRARCASYRQTRPL
jgi:hypothetical protein